MCLQWCHVHHYLIDNDDPCTHCTYSTHLLPQHRCSTCQHRIDREPSSRTVSHDNIQHGGDITLPEHVLSQERHAICGLTHMALPQRGGCCHANVILDTPPDGVIWLTRTSLAPSLIEMRGTTSVADIFNDSVSAPGYQVTSEGTLGVQLDQLALPEVYGVPADEWYHALGRTPPTYTWPQPSEPAESTFILPIIDEICHYLEGQQHDETTRNQLREQIQSLPPLSATWNTLVNEALQALETL